MFIDEHFVLQVILIYFYKIYFNKFSSMKFLLIILIIIYIIPPYLGVANYLIGLDKTYFGIPIPSITTNIVVGSFDKPNFTNLQEFSSAVNSLNLTYDYIINSYDASLVWMTSQNEIPYLVIPEMGNDTKLSSNVFYIPSIAVQTSECTRALLSFFNVSSIVFLDYAPNPQFKNIVAFNKFSQTLLLVGNDTALSDIFLDKNRYNTANTYVTTIPLYETSLIKRLLDEAMLKGQLNPGKIWIFMAGGFNNDSDFDVFKPYGNVGANIYSYGVNFTIQGFINTAIFRQYVINDFLLFINKSLTNFTNSKPTNKSNALNTAVLTTGILSNNGNFDPNSNKYRGSVILIKKVNNIQGPVDIYNYTDKINVLNPNLNSLSLSDPSVTVRIGIALSKGYFMQKPNGEYYGFSVGILSELLNLTSFKYQYVQVPLNSDLPVYNLLNQLLKNNTVDIILIPMVSDKVEPAMFLSDPVLSGYITMLTRPPDNIIASAVLAPFTFNVWLGIILIILLLTLGFWAISAVSPPESKKKGKETVKPYSFGFTFLVIYSSFVMAKLKVKLLQLSSQIFAFILWFATLTLVVVYASNLLPYLMKTNYTYPFSKPEDLININKPTITYQWRFVKNSIDVDLIRSDSTLLPLYNFSSEKWPNSMFVEDLRSEKALEENNSILIQMSYKNNYIYHSQNCSSDLFRGTDTQYQFVFPMNPNWPQREEMKRLLTKITDSGVIGVNSIIYFGQGPCARASTSINPSPIPLTLSKLIFLFSIPAAGCFLGLFYVILIILIAKIGRCIKNANREKFVMGKSYEARVSSIDHNGIWALINNRDRPYYINSTSLHSDLARTYTPAELGYKSGDTLVLKYFGKDPISGYKRFCKEIDEEV